jgi:multicomponent Na+:H+ antiporter subunit B
MNLVHLKSRFWQPKFLALLQPDVLGIAIVLIGLALILNLAITFEQTPSAKEYLYRYGTAETGAVNLVTSIYLGYRVFDTLGETIVLMLAVAGVILLIGRKS